MNKILGTRGCQIVVGVGPHAVKTGYKAYALVVRVAGTQIKSMTQSGVAVTDESFENVALILNEYLPLEKPLTSITLNAAGDSVIMYLQVEKE